MLYDMIHPNASESFTVRSVFVIGPGNRVKTHYHVSPQHRPKFR